MNLVQRMEGMAQERRRQLQEQERPQFAIGVAPRPTNRSPRLHPCNTASPSLTPLKPLILFAAKIPYECMIAILMSGIQLKDRSEMLEVQRQSIACIHPEEMRTKLLETLREKEYWFMIESKCRTAFRNLVSRWLFKRYSRNHLNTEDPATLSEPIQPIRIFDATARGTYVFEAVSLRKSMERDLNYCDWLFPEPFHPKNPLTNLPFHMGHRLHILQQLRLYNQGSWILESYHALKWNLKAFRDIFLVPLKARALHDICRNSTSEDTIDYMSEFIEDHYGFHEIHRPEILIILKWAVRQMPIDPYMLEWLHAFKHIYSIQIIYGEHYLDNNPTIQTALYEITHTLLKQITEMNRLAKIRNERIQERRRQRAAEEVPPEEAPPESSAIETIRGPVSNPQLQASLDARFELGDISIDVLAERVARLVGGFSHANTET